LRTSRLIFGVTSAYPIITTQWLTCLAGTGFSPAGNIDLARPHTPFDYLYYVIHKMNKRNGDADMTDLLPWNLSLQQR
jgi:hypothetical protein